MPPPSRPPGGRPSQGHPSLPSKPHLPDTSPSQAATIPPARSVAKPATTATETLPTPHSNNLHDMEQQRRQELLARKAVIASRKSKMLASVKAFSNTDPAMASPPETPDSQMVDNPDVEMAVPTETVDDFLKSIEPNPEATSIAGQLAHMDSHIQEQRMPGDDMDVDEIPGLGSIRSFHVPPNTTPSEQGLISVMEHRMAVSPTLSAANSLAQFDYPPSSTESRKTTFNNLSTPDSSFLSESQYLQRRGPKRPVASDFVDFEAAPRSHGNLNGGYSNGGVSTNPPSRNVLGNGFASASGMRRCVIDLSDSEGEDDEKDAVRDIGGNGKDKWGRHSGFVSPAPVRPTVTTSNAVGGWLTLPVSSVTPGSATVVASSGGTMSPAALMEKEIEIRKMRELIAQREQNRLKKVAVCPLPVICLAIY
jgi:hypothetical protein